MNAELKRDRTPRRILALLTRKPVSDRTVVPPRTVLETRRSILKKLSARLRRDVSVRETNLMLFSPTRYRADPGAGRVGFVSKTSNHNLNTHT